MPNQLQHHGQALKQAYSQTLAAMGLDADNHPPVSALGMEAPACPNCGCQLQMQFLDTNSAKTANGAINSIALAGHCSNCNGKFAVSTRIEYSTIVSPLTNQSLEAKNPHRLSDNRSMPALPKRKSPLMIVDANLA